MHIVIDEVTPGESDREFDVDSLHETYPISVLSLYSW